MDGVSRFLIILILSVLSCIVLIYTIGITQVERKVINFIVIKKLGIKYD